MRTREEWLKFRESDLRYEGMEYISYLLMSQDYEPLSCEEMLEIAKENFKYENSEYAKVTFLYLAMLRASGDEYNDPWTCAVNYMLLGTFEDGCLDEEDVKYYEWM